jgi:tetratricopeptide (TPR) repeat protein
MHGALEPITCPASAAVANGAEFVSLSPRDGENTNGRMNMQAAANSNLILTDLSSFKRLAGLQKDLSHGAFYQQVLSELIRGVYRKQTISELGNSLVALAEHTYDLRDTDTVEKASEFLLNLPLGKEYEDVGRYYQALCIYRRGQFDEARILLEQIAGELPLRFRGKALLAAATTNYESGDLKSCLLLNVEASRAATSTHLRDPLTFVTSQRNIAVVKSIDGDHRGALSDLENLFPLARAVGRWQPYLFYEHLNSLAVELCEVGRLEEARHASQIALASPFAPAYPEWRETREEIELRGWRASRATVAFGQRTSEAEDFARLGLRADRSETDPNRIVCQPGNVVSLPVREPDRRDSAEPAELVPGDQKRSARVFSLEEHKKRKVSEKPNDEPKGEHTQEELNKMTTSELLVAIMNRISNDVSDDALARVLSLLDEIALENKEKT